MSDLGRAIDEGAEEDHPSGRCLIHFPETAFGNN